MSLLYALMMQYQADIEKAKANINVYLENPAGIGEHADIVSAVDSQIEIIAHAEDKLMVIDKHFTESK
jgi:hypothetical protein